MIHKISAFFSINYLTTSFLINKTDSELINYLTYLIQELYPDFTFDT